MAALDRSIDDDERSFTDETDYQPSEQDDGDSEGWQFRVPPPPEASYQTLDDLLLSVDSWCQVRGIELVRGPLQGDTRIDARCSRHGSLSIARCRNRHASKRQRTSNGTGCRMNITCIKRSDGTWSVKHTANNDSFFHNHPIATTDFLTEAQVLEMERENLQAMVKSHVAEGVTMLLSEAECRMAFPTLSRTETELEDIRNVYREAVQLAGIFTPTLTMLNKAKCFVKYEHNSESDPHRFFCAHTEMIAHLKEERDVILFDSTYSTSAWRKPWLNIYGVDGDSKAFHVATCLLQRTERDDFEWALQTLLSLMEQHHIKLPRLIVIDRDLEMLEAVKLAFPGIHLRLCTWRLDCEMMAQSKKHTMETKNVMSKVATDHELTHKNFNFYKKVLLSSTMADYQYNLESLELHWPAGKAYLYRHCLKDWKEFSVSYWTDKRLNFGIQSISRCKGAYGKLRVALGSTPANLHSLFDCLLSSWDSQTEEMRDRHHQNQGVPIGSPYLYSRLHTRIWPFAITQISILEERANKRLAREKQTGKVSAAGCCDCRDMQITDLPCQHTVLARLRAHTPLEPREFERHWHIGSTITVLERCQQDEQAPATFRQPQAAISAQASASSQQAQAAALPQASKSSQQIQASASLQQTQATASSQTAQTSSLQQEVLKSSATAASQTSIAKEADTVPSVSATIETKTDPRAPVATDTDSCISPLRTERSVSSSAIPSTPHADKLRTPFLSQQTMDSSAIGSDGQVFTPPDHQKASYEHQRPMPTYPPTQQAYYPMQWVPPQPQLYYPQCVPPPGYFQQPYLYPPQPHWQMPTPFHQASYYHHMHYQTKPTQNGVPQEMATPM